MFGLIATLAATSCAGGDRLTYDSRDELRGTTTTTAVDPPYRSYIATAPDTTKPVPLYDAVGGPPSTRTVPNPNENGVVSTFLVEQRNVLDDQGGRWLLVELPIRPNGSTAWVKESDVVLSFTDLKVVVARTEHQLRVEKAAVAWGARGGRVNSISPGIISTPMGRQELEQGSSEQMQGMLDLSPVPRIGTAEDIAAAVHWLTSTDASFVTGCDLRVDGGVTAAIHALMAGG